MDDPLGDIWDTQEVNSGRVLIPILMDDPLGAFDDAYLRRRGDGLNPYSNG